MSFVAFNSSDFVEEPFYLYYSQILCSDLVLKDNYQNIHDIPKLTKVTLNTTSRQYGIEKKNLLAPYFAFQLITGQNPTLTSAKKSVASFQIREGQLLGIRVTLRKKALYRFFTILNTIVFPKSRDFLGIKYTSTKHQIMKQNPDLPISFSFLDILAFPELENHFDTFHQIQAFNLNLGISKGKVKFHGTWQQAELKSPLLFTAFQFPVIPSQK